MRARPHQGTVLTVLKYTTGTRGEWVRSPSAHTVDCRSLRRVISCGSLKIRRNPLRLRQQRHNSLVVHERWLGLREVPTRAPLVVLFVFPPCQCAKVLVSYPRLATLTSDSWDCFHRSDRADLSFGAEHRSRGRR